VVSHDRDLAFGVADRIAVINEGRIVTIGTPDEVKKFQRPARPEIFARRFQTRKIIKAYEKFTRNQARHFCRPRGHCRRGHHGNPRRLEIFQGGYHVSALFDTVQDLKVGDSVKMAGVEIGRVEKIALADDKVRSR
jgi:ABC-type proline/glycine betaine transport system ATPase subunit